MRRWVGGSDSAVVGDGVVRCRLHAPEGDVGAHHSPALSGGDTERRTMGRHSVVEERMTLHEALAAAAAVYGDRTSFVCDDTRLTLGEIRTRALALAGVLAGQGIGSGDRIA